MNTKTKKVLVNYLKKGLKKGFTLKTLKNALLKQGYSTSDVNEAIKVVVPPEEKKFKPKILLVIIAAVILLIALTSLFFILKKEKKEVELKPKEEIGIEEEIRSIFTKSVQETNRSLCDKITDPALRKKCMTNFILVQAEKQQDITICNQLGERFIEQCKYQVIMKKVLNTGNIDLCNQLSEENKEHCIMSVTFMPEELVVE